MNAAAPTEAEILSHAFTRLDKPQDAKLLRLIERLRLPEKDLDRVDFLAGKVREGIITDTEREELDKYLRVGNFLDQIRAWALRQEKQLSSN